MSTYTPMIQQYLSVKADYQDAFLFFRLGDFYEMFFDDAQLASRELEITLTGRDGGAKEKIPMCGVPYHSADSYINKLIEKGYKVAICEQVENPKETKSVVKREVVRVITPGTLMEGKVIEGSRNNYIASISINKERNMFGLSVADISTGEFYSTEIRELDELITELNQYNPSEIIIPLHLAVDYEEQFKNLTKTVTIIDKHNLDREGNINLLSNQFKELDNLQNFSNELIDTAGQLLSYLQATQQQYLAHFNQLTLYDAKQFMTLDPFSRKNLELTQTTREQTKKGSLLWLLDKCETAMGSRLMRRWLDKPLLSKTLIEERLNYVESFYTDLILAEDLKNELKEMYDIERIVSKIAYGNATPRDIQNLKISLTKVPNIYHLIIDSSQANLKSLVNTMDMCQDITELIDQAINDDAPISIKEGGIIKRGYDQKLDQLYLASTEGKNWLKELETRERLETGIKSLKIGFNKVFGYYIEITKSNLAQVPERYIRKQTLANAERYITEELKEKENQILESEEKMLDLEYQLFLDVRDRIGFEVNRLQKLAQLIARIDVLLSFAKVSSTNNYIKPSINQDGMIFIKAGRHPVIEAIQKGQPYIPNDVLLDQNSEQILMITGPNMAGKSTYMRQIAIAVIMTQMGCFVPADEANIAITDRIFTRIGAGDDLTSGHSTFMVEMLETRQAIVQASVNSLILLDEIGRGTSTYDGMALAQAIIEHIHENVRAKTLFSTHYHELTSLENRFSRIKNVHVNVIEQDGQVIFLHKIQEGKADKSYGIHVAELAGMPSEVINNAKLILKELESKKHTKIDESKPVQLDLFNDTTKKSIKDKKHFTDPKYKEIIERLDSIDILSMTPMEGFQFLYEIQKQLRK